MNAIFLTSKKIDSTKYYNVVIIRIAFRKVKSIRTFSFIKLLYIYLYQILFKHMINWSVFAQLASLALVVLSGPAIIFLLYFKQGNM